MADRDPGITFEELNDLYEAERRRTQLTKLPHNYFTALSHSLHELRLAYHKAQEAAPGSPKALMLGDELRNMTTLAQHVYNKRLKKLALLALTEASGVTVDTKMIHPTESPTFEQLSEVLGESRRSMLPTDSDAQGEAAATRRRVSRGIGRGRRGASAPSGAGTSEPAAAAAAPAASEGGEERVLVEALEDIGEFVAQHGETVQLHKDDVISLPAGAAKVLLQRGLVREVEGTRTA